MFSKNFLGPRAGRDPVLKNIMKYDVIGYLIIMLIKAYRYFISPMLAPSCRYIPTCSSYAIDAIKRYGCARGVALALARLLKCHPFGGHGLNQIERK